MKIQEIISESVTFSPSILKKSKHGEYWTDEDFRKEVEKTCWVCDGTGQEDQYTCRYCKGSGKIKEWEFEDPNLELNVSNSNAMYILRTLGLEPDYSGIIPNNKLPELLRKLIKLKNDEISKYTIDPSTERRKPTTSTDSSGVTHISHGPRIYHGGVSENQVTRYLDRLISMAKFAQKHGASISWA